MPAQIFSWWSMSLRAFQERAALGILVLLTVLFILNGLAVFVRAKSERIW
jgi:phosphate transport system permease protein